MSVIKANGFGPLPRDLRKAAASLGLAEVRYLVDLYYQIQDFRKASRNQILSMGEEPHATLAFFAERFEQIERQITAAMDVYSMGSSLGQWARGHIGVGPVIAAGLLAHIDIARVQTAGQIWRYAGLDDPANYDWGKGKKRPWNASLKTLCWKLGDSFVKFSGREDCFYGHRIYRDRKAYELRRDAEGGNAAAAAKTLERQPNHKQAAVYRTGHLPDGRLDLRARRYAVKLFLSHYFEEGYRQLHGSEPPSPYPIAHLGHAHKIDPPAGLVESTEAGERASTRESTVRRERAVGHESTEKRERAVAVESTVRSERAE